MKFISWNVNGFRACLNKGFGDFFANEDADFFAIQESKMQPGQAEFDTPNHHQFWYSAEKKGYSGTAIFAKREPISVKYGIGIDEHDHEGRAITLEYENFYNPFKILLPIPVPSPFPTKLATIIGVCKSD